ncbi:MAG: hypothetical protein Ta2B_27050 [Termitinemataceae bacterium]|nr:MAG: hypothetical protein Ta2B_27050 [Termitinemataceae bacterium]
MKQIIFLTLILSTIGCASVPAKPGDSKQDNTVESLFGIEWKLTEIKISGKTVVLNRESMKDEFTINFSDERISGKAFPNRYSAPYETRIGNNLSFKQIVSTRMLAMNEPYPIKEDDYLKYMQTINSWNLINGTLCLRGISETGNEVLLFFSK